MPLELGTGYLTFIMNMRIFIAAAAHSFTLENFDNASWEKREYCQIDYRQQQQKNNNDKNNRRKVANAKRILYLS